MKNDKNKEILQDKNKIKENSDLFSEKKLLKQNYLRLIKLEI
ncbi:hypothetical protein [Leptotrichia hofstadii]|uniref:Uncharacterized protein n=1 Tax=Leptotrichia hofstadii F0254 TaxID=634994 RepID=C9N1I1_9FUSO|nr:hypothetical protein [Leptotrichia hofstadii]EEX73374.1 hypothetical protein GCWU000323_02702 [Leptotrichia hofstadii F0254]